VWPLKVLLILDVVKKLATWVVPLFKPKVKAKKKVR
jgi:hypothetical protein